MFAFVSICGLRLKQLSLQSTFCNWRRIDIRLHCRVSYFVRRMYLSDLFVYPTCSLVSNTAYECSLKEILKSTGGRQLSHNWAFIYSCLFCWHLAQLTDRFWSDLHLPLECLLRVLLLSAKVKKKVSISSQVSDGFSIKLVDFTVFQRVGH